MSTFERSPKVLLGVSGGIAAYKACEVLRGLQKAGCEVRVAMTESATRFVGTVTFEALTGHAVATDVFTYRESSIPHISLSEWADVILVVPATGNVMAKAAHGIADDCLSATMLAGAGKLLFAPAMNVHMWQAAATQANVELLRSRGEGIITPETGRLACGDVGEGKLASVDTIVEVALDYLAHRLVPQDLAGRRVLVTAGPTHEPIDPVRYIANRSSGKMGFAIARAIQRRGGQAVIVAGPTSLEAPYGAEIERVGNAAQMYEASRSVFTGCDAAICAAAVADYTPKAPADHKLKKDKERLDVVELVETHDILRELSATKDGRVVVGFAAETNDAVANAQAKLARKGCDMIVCNDVSREDAGFGTDTNAVTFVTADGIEERPLMSKDDVANELLDRLVALMERRA